MNSVLVHIKQNWNKIKFSQDQTIGVIVVKLIDNSNSNIWCMYDFNKCLINKRLSVQFLDRSL